MKIFGLALALIVTVRPEFPDVHADKWLQAVFLSSSRYR